MLKKWLTWINQGLAASIALLFVGALVVSFIRPSEFSLPDPALVKKTAPVCTFAMPKQKLDCIGNPVLGLKFSPMPLQLPDLRQALIYCGKNGRPDAPQDNATLHFALNGNTNLATSIAGEPLYLLFDKKAPSRYVFSPNNAKTSLWIEATPQGNEAVVKLFLKNEAGIVISEPATHAQFNLPERENMRLAGRSWDLGKWRVDGSLLARQKARWLGPDRFIEKHGGDEYKALMGKHRVDFTDDETNYSVYVGLNDVLIWDENTWKMVKPGEDSLKYPMMVVKRVEDRLMGFELWDVEGKGKIVLNLVRTNENWPGQNLESCFKCVGARTRSQYIFEIADQRVFLSPQDWLLQTDEGWMKLTKANDIDDYVNRKLSGVLFVFNGVGRKEDEQVLMGTMFNPSRTETKDVELPIQHPGMRRILYGSAGKGAKGQSALDDDDDDFDDDDDDDDPVPIRRPQVTESVGGVNVSPGNKPTPPSVPKPAAATKGVKKKTAATSSKKAAPKNKGASVKGRKIEGKNSNKKPDVVKKGQS